jgi:hypothetical protein
MSAANFHAEDLQALVVTQLTTDDIRRSKCFVRLERLTMVCSVQLPY